METRYFGKPVRRNEDPRLLSGEALFTDDVHLPEMAHAAFVRSPHAHAQIVDVDISAAEEMDGVIAVYTAESLGDYWQPGPLLVSPPPIKDIVFNERTQVPLAKEKVRFAGEPVVMVVAESRYIAEDAVDAIWVQYEPLEPVVDLELAVARDAPRVHDDVELVPGVGSNVNAHVVQVKGEGRGFDAIAREAAAVVKRRFYYDHGTAAAMENRGVVADWDHRAGRMTIWDTTQAPVFIRNGMAALLGLSENQVRVIAPFIGGGFGPKIMMFYQEEVLVPWASVQLRRPVKWIEDRSENFVATTQERDQIHWAEMALDEEGRILAVRDRFLHDAGAYAPYGLTVPLNSQCTLLGCYDVPAYYSEFTSVFTNKTIVTPYRGAGRQHGVFVMERLLDLGARELGIDRAEIRRRNFIPPEKFPYNNEIIYQDFAPLTYDSGNYEPALDLALELIGYDDFFERIQPQARAEGRALGLGLVCYVEGTGIGPYEGARVQVQNNGRVSVATGIGTQGQGHFTSFAQIVADQLGVHPSEVDIVTGDTDQFHWGAGTFASRGAVVAGNAINAAAAAVRGKILKMGSARLDNVSEEHLELVDGHVQIKDTPESAIPLGELAQAANPMRGAVEPGTEPGLESSDYFGPKYGATASGVHAMIVEIDPETMALQIVRYVIVHDCGRVINPLILDGQIHGGVAQGIGNAFYEKLSYSDTGQLLSGSFMDYLLPTAMEVPRMEVDHIVTPSPLNPLGTKGAGEAGAIPVGPLFAQAIEDALGPEGPELLEIPLSPSRLWELLNEHGE
ncbi:MAG: xanthine dehydrogenase family protein molybdopterin-binding subunit [Candidatus Promineifilaceae bacterium]|nr:xanthine dehydrogenase family protein molybdopterin-binding subunit [Candidatus Promineifilaceae bacterium]